MKTLEDKKLRLTFLYEKLAKQESKKPRSRRVEKHIQDTQAEIKQLEEELK